MSNRRRLSDAYEKLPLFEKTPDINALALLHNQLDRIDLQLIRSSFLLDALQPWLHGKVSLRFVKSKDSETAVSWYFCEWLYSRVTCNWHYKRIAFPMVARKLKSINEFAYTQVRCKRLVAEALDMIAMRKKIAEALLRLRQAQLIIKNSTTSMNQWARTIGEVALETKNKYGNGFDISEDPDVQELLMVL
ncbi:hypothetical protein [Craterilacuibacter sp.]|uniref:hypothetical protein n=1 Tax=Craterilacuibacter sp. TaxID=2870909 RepID=UPI003F2B07B8